MSATELLERLESLGIEIQAADGKLRVSAPRDQLTEELRAEIAAHKAALLELLAARSGPVLRRLPRTGPLPVSSFQERLWVLNKLQPDSTAYNMAVLLPVQSTFDDDRLRATIRNLVTRHETLRARFQDDDGVPTVTLMPADAVPLELRDFRGRSQDAAREEIEATARRAARVPFDLSAEVPSRFTLFRVTDEWVAVLIVAHHVAVDAWSLGMLGRELTAVLGGAPEPEPLEIQYVDYAAWQRASEDARLIQPELDWWKQYLAGSPPLSTLPPDGQRSPDAPGATHSFRFDPALTARLHAMARAQNATIYMALVAACAAMLHWYTAQDDLVLGSPMGVRERPEFERIIGPFVNVLLLRLDLSDDPTFAQLLERARAAVLDAHAHRRVSFERLVQYLNPVRSLDHDPLFQVSVVYNAGEERAIGEVSSGGAIADLTWFVREANGELFGSLEYRADLYSSGMIEGVRSRLERILTQAAENPHVRLSAMSLVTPEESARVLREFNDTDRAVDLAPFVAQLERQVAASPDAPAVTFESTTLSYAELNARANRIGAYLRSLNVAPGTIVGLCLPRSLDMLAALIGVQKAGGAYLPLDPDFPAERLGFMLADSGARVVVTAGSLPRDLEISEGVLVVDLRDRAGEIDALPPDNPPPVLQPSDLAYVMYTSGSTGRPKGVRVSHRALSNFLGAMRIEPGMSAADTLAAVTTLSFDIAAFELYLPLIAGARVVLASRDVAVDGHRLAALLASERVTMLQATPATWRLLVEAEWQGGPTFRALTGGEALPPELAASLLPRVGELWNMYGPTETTVWSTIARVERADQITIGRPIANTRVYVLDAGRHLMPVGVPGELWIGGDGVAEGYQGRPDLTNERFVNDPFDSTRPRARMYRTGDRARWRADGTLEHLGRLDAQVKVRGYRIELGEIEAVLEAHEAVRQAVVMARTQSSGDVRLVAYIVYEPGEDLSVSEVRRWLRARLPDYMIPSIFITLESLPLTPNGKIDRNALPDPFAHGGRNLAAERTPPAPGIESVLADIWREVLEVPAVGAEDNFFELGGHSLLALRVTAAVHRRTGWRMDPRLLFFQQLRQIAAAAPSHLAPGLRS